MGESNHIHTDAHTSTEIHIHSSLSLSALPFSPRLNNGGWRVVHATLVSSAQTFPRLGCLRSTRAYAPALLHTWTYSICALPRCMRKVFSSRRPPPLAAAKPGFLFFFLHSSTKGERRSLGECDTLSGKSALSLVFPFTRSE